MTNYSDDANVASRLPRVQIIQSQSTFQVKKGTLCTGTAWLGAWLAGPAVGVWWHRNSSKQAVKLYVSVPHRHSGLNHWDVFYDFLVFRRKIESGDNDLQPLCNPYCDKQSQSVVQFWLLGQPWIVRCTCNVIGSFCLFLQLLTNWTLWLIVKWVVDPFWVFPGKFMEYVVENFENAHVNRT